MTWRRFSMLLSGLSSASRWQGLLAADAEKPRVLSADAWARQFPKAGS